MARRNGYDTGDIAQGMLRRPHILWDNIKYIHFKKTTTKNLQEVKI